MKHLVFLFCFLLNLNAEQSLFPDKVLICGVCKDIERQLPNMMNSIEKIGGIFSDYRVFIYENNSADRTVAILNNWAAINSKVNITSENIPLDILLSQGKSKTWNNLPFRTEVIARARNIVLQKALDPKFDDYKYVIMLDMDFQKPINLNGIILSISQKANWDAILANGINDKLDTFDRYALRDDNMPLGPELLGEEWWRHMQRTPTSIVGKRNLIPVYSAFGGLGIYKRNSIKKCSYSGVITPELEKLTKQILIENPFHPEAQKYFNRDNTKQSIVLLSNESDSIKWICNSGGYNMPVCCEHVTFHAMMYFYGHDKIFINPRMLVEY